MQDRIPDAIYMPQGVGEIHATDVCIIEVICDSLQEPCSAGARTLGGRLTKYKDGLRKVQHVICGCM